MTHTEIEQAAERLRKLWSEGGTMDAAYGVALSLEGQRTYCSFDMEACARAYLALQPLHKDLVAALSDLIPTPFPSDDEEDCQCVEVLVVVGQLRAARTVLSRIEK